jgi:hypothetical protein
MAICFVDINRPADSLVFQTMKKLVWILDSSS